MWVIAFLSSGTSDPSPWILRRAHLEVLGMVLPNFLSRGEAADLLPSGLLLLLEPQGPMCGAVLVTVVCLTVSR